MQAFRRPRRAPLPGLPLAAIVLVALVVASCGGATSPNRTSAPTGKAPPDYSFLLVNPAGLIALDAKGKVLGPIAELPRDSAPSNPILLPGRKSIAFSITLVPTGSSGFGSDVWTVDLDGSSLDKVIVHEAENVFYSSPIVDPSGKFLYVQRRAAVIENGQYTGNDDSVNRLDLATKKLTRIVDHAVDPALSPDGKTIVYVKYDEKGTPVGLWRVNPDGTGNRKFFSTTDTWWYMQSPRFSPDGKWLVFSGAGHNARSSRGAGKLAHLGIPSEIYLAAADGSSVKVIGQTGDDTTPAWAPDASQIAYVATGALWLLTVADGKVDQITKGDNFFFGELVWLKR